jgi:hypothetical protein
MQGWSWSNISRPRPDDEKNYQQFGQRRLPTHAVTQ